MTEPLRNPTPGFSRRRALAGVLGAGSILAACGGEAAPAAPAAKAEPTKAPAASAPTAAPAQESEVTPAESPVPSADAPPPPAVPSSVVPSHSDGPRINVTRTPMSFTPGQIPAN